MAAVIGQIDRIVRPHMNAVRPRILALAPRAQEVALAIEYHDRVFPAVENIDVVVGADPDRPDLLEGPPVRQLRPILYDAVFEIAGANNNGHARFSPYALSASYRSNRPDTILLSPPRPAMCEPVTGTPARRRRVVRK